MSFGNNFIQYVGREIVCQSDHPERKGPSLSFFLSLSSYALQTQKSNIDFNVGTPMYHSTLAATYHSILTASPRLAIFNVTHISPLYHCDCWCVNRDIYIFRNYSLSKMKLNLSFYMASFRIIKNM